MKTLRLLPRLAVLCAGAVGCATSPKPARSPDISPAPTHRHELRLDLGLGASSFATHGGTPWNAGKFIRRDRYEVALLADGLGGYVSYSKGLEDPGRELTRWVQRDVELGARWAVAERRSSHIHAQLTLGLGGVYSWIRSGSVDNYEPILLVFGSGSPSTCDELVDGAATPSKCNQSGPTFHGHAGGFTPSILGTIGSPGSAFVGLRLDGRYLWVGGTNTPSFVYEHEALLLVGGAWRE